jgi:hypothetical protein
MKIVKKGKMRDLHPEDYNQLSDTLKFWEDKSTRYYLEHNHETLGNFKTNISVPDSMIEDCNFDENKYVIDKATQRMEMSAQKRLQDK